MMLRYSLLNLTVMKLSLRSVLCVNVKENPGIVAKSNEMAFLSMLAKIQLL